VLLPAAALLASLLATDGGVALPAPGLDEPPRDAGCAEYQVPYQGKCMAKKRFVVLLGTIEGWRDSCANGDKRGCAPLGETYRDGTLVPKSPEYAARLFKRGCDAQEPMACRLLAESLQKTDAKEAAVLLAKSCELGEPPACTALGKALEDGTGVKADKKKARAVYGKGCELGAQPACQRASELDAK
jgi:TPR repeat protein